jgi:hypothetical protein
MIHGLDSQCCWDYGIMHMSGIIYCMERACRSVLNMLNILDCQDEAHASLLGKAKRMNHLCQMLLLWMKTVTSRPSGTLYCDVWEAIDNALGGDLTGDERELIDASMACPGMNAYASKSNYEAGVRDAPAPLPLPASPAPAPAPSVQTTANFRPLGYITALVGLPQSLSHPFLLAVTPSNPLSPRG